MMSSLFGLAVLSLVNISNQADRFLLAFAKPSIQSSLHISDGQWGVLVGFGFSTLFALAGLPLGHVIDRVSRRWALACALFLWSAVTALTAQSTGFLSLCGFRLLLGASQATGNPSALSLLTDLFEDDHLAAATAAYTASLYVGIGLSSMVGAVLVQTHGWRFAFRAFGASGAAVLVLLMLLREPQRGGRRAAEGGSLSALSAEETAIEPLLEASGPLSSSSPPAPTTFSGSIASILSLHSFWRVALAGAVRTSGGHVLSGFVPGELLQLLPGHEKTEVNVLYGAVVMACGGVGCVTVGLVSRRWRIQPLRAAAVGNLLAAPFTAGLMLVARGSFGGTVGQRLGWSMACFGASLVLGEGWGGLASAVIQKTLPITALGTGIALYFCTVNILSSIGPAATGALLDRFPDHRATVIAAVCSSCYVASSLLFLEADRHIESDMEMRREMEAAPNKRGVLARPRKIMFTVGALLALAATTAAIVWPLA
jgi:MFS family permease